MVIEDLSDVPPAALLLHSEVYAKAKSWEDARKLLKALLPELQVQSRAYDLQRFGKDCQKPIQSEFDIHLDGALNFFSRSSGGCSDVGCRVAAAERTARSIGLIADRVWITDYLTETFCDFGRATNERMNTVLADVQVLGTLMPLIAGGVLRFKSPWIPSCKGCLEQFDKRVQQIAVDLHAAFVGGFELEDRGGNRYALQTGAVFEPTVVLRLSNERNKPVGPPDVGWLTQKIVHDAVHSAMWVGREAAASRGSVFSNSRIGLAGFVHQDGRFKSLADLKILDEARSVDLPWVSELTPSQLMELRNEACSALPQFRELMAKGLVYRPDSKLGGDVDMIYELRQQAAEVRDELQIINRNAKRFWKQPFMLLSLGAAALGLATDQPLGAASGLLALWQFLGTHESGNEKDVDKLKCRPGYVLIKAHDLLAHAAK